MNNKIKSILFACLMLVGVNAVKADVNVPIPAGVYYFTFDFGTYRVYELNVFHDSNTSPITMNGTQNCNCGITLNPSNVKNVRNTESGINTLVVTITEDTYASETQVFLKIAYGATNNSLTWLDLKYQSDFNPQSVSSGKYVCKVTPEGFEWLDYSLDCETEGNCNPILTYSASSGGSVTAKAGGEDVSSGSSVAPGTEVTLTAIPHLYYEFSHWVTDDGVVGYETNHIITMPNHSYSVQAIFTTEDKDASLGAECEDCFYVTP